MSETVADAFISYEYDDAIGPIKRNATDALFAIAEAVTRLAVSQENLIATQREAMAMSAHTSAMMMQAMTARFPGFGDDGPGHA